MKKSKMNFESSIEKLRDIAQKLESGEENLEDSILLYQEGMDICSYCEQMLSAAKQKITIIENKTEEI